MKVEIRPWCAAIVACAAFSVRAAEDLASYVDPFTGTAGTGHTHPSACVPFGMVQAGPDTGIGDWAYCSGYQYRDRAVLGYLQTHLSGTGCPDYNDIQILPFAGELGAHPARRAIDKATERAEPGYYAVVQPDDGVRVEIAAAKRAAIYRLSGGRDGEIKGAQAAYAAVETFDPLSARDLLKAHALMTKGLVDRPGKWRKCNVGVFNAKGEALHHAPPWDHVPFLMRDLFAWLKRAKDLPLIKSCVFHFAFECIHPFPDGNGRVGRLWQTAILGRWNPLFYAAPVENMVFSHQSRYYRALQSAQAAGDAGVFVDFMLDVILRTIRARGVRQGGKKEVVRKGGKKTADRILELVSANPKVTFAEMVGELGISRSAIQKHIAGLKDAQRLRRIGPDKGGRWDIVAV